MFTLMLHALTTTADIPTTMAYDTQVLTESCGRRLVADFNPDLGERELFVQDVDTGAIVYSEVTEIWVDLEERADTLDLCGLAG